jgi:hypothetical protein
VVCAVSRRGKIEVFLMNSRRIKEPERMDDIYTYHIEVQGQMDENAFNASSPLQVIVAQADPAVTLFTIYADQSGFIGLIRHLHRQGFVLISVYRER